MPLSVVLSHSSPCNVPQGYAAVAELPAAFLGIILSFPRVRFLLSKTSRPSEFSCTEMGFPQPTGPATILQTIDGSDYESNDT
jgi:hypothetical protein